jgi:hypothetical protein
VLALAEGGVGDAAQLLGPVSEVADCLPSAPLGQIELIA